MSSTELERQIAALEKKREQVVKKTDSLLLATRDELSAAVSGWMHNHVLGLVEKRAAFIQSVGQDSLRAFKGEVMKLMGRAPEIVDAALADRDNWPHRGSAAPKAYLESVFRKSINALGPVLDRYGFLSAGEWEKRGGSYHYAYNPAFDPTRITGLDGYETAVSQARDLTSQLAAKRAELEKAKARELWESI